MTVSKACIKMNPVPLKKVKTTVPSAARPAPIPVSLSDSHFLCFSMTNSYDAQGSRNEKYEGKCVNT